MKNVKSTFNTIAILFNVLSDKLILPVSAFASAYRNYIQYNSTLEELTKCLKELKSSKSKRDLENSMNDINFYLNDIKNYVKKLNQ